MTTVLWILLAQSLLGGADNLLHHELQARLPARASARRELALHAAREAIYGVVFLTLAWTVPTGLWAWLLAALLAIELAITAADFLEEDRSRRLPPVERVLHLVLAVGYGVFLAVFAPFLLAWMGAPTAIAVTGYGALSIALTVVGLGVAVWSVRNAVAAATLRRPAPAAAPGSSGPTTLVAGGTGFIGSELVGTLLTEGGRVILLTRDPLQARAQFARRVTAVDRLDDIPSETRIDAVVDLAGAPVLGPHWTARRRRRLHASRAGVTTALVGLIQRLETKPAVLVTASAVGFYGSSDAESPADESAPPQPGFAAELCRAREDAAAAATPFGVRTVVLRFGVVLGRSGGVLPPMALASRLGLGAVLGDGRQPMPWIHLADAVGLIRFAVAEPGVAGPVNAVAPEATRQAGFVATLAAARGWRVRLKVPATALRLLLGTQSTLLLDGRLVSPARALAAGYRFRHPALAPALATLFAGRTRAGGERNPDPGVIGQSYVNGGPR